jgi:hypothetical protein
MIPKKKTLIPKSRRERIGRNLRRPNVDVPMLKDYDEIPRLTAEWFQRTRLHFGEVPIHGPGRRVRIDQMSRQAGMLPKVPRKKAR